MEEPGPEGCHDGFNGHLSQSVGFPTGSVVKNLPASVRDTGSIPGSESLPGEGNGSILTWEISWTKEPGGLHSMGSQRVTYG